MSNFLIFLIPKDTCTPKNPAQASENLAAVDSSMVEVIREVGLKIRNAEGDMEEAMAGGMVEGMAGASMVSMDKSMPMLRKVEAAIAVAMFDCT